MIDRPAYLDKLIRFREPSLVKVLAGVRRCGKSSLLTLLKNWLIENGTPEQSIIEISYEKPSFFSLQDPKALYEYVRDRISDDTTHYLFVDEVQELEQWAHTINGIRAEFNNLDIYVTGSNARMFSGEHLTYLSGRYVQIDVYPLSLAEYIAFKSPEGTPSLSLEDQLDNGYLERSYQEYITTGSLPAVALSDDQLLTEAILQGVFDSVFTRDILLRGNIRNEAAFLRVSRFALDNIGNQTSASTIANTLKSSGHSITPDTVDNYLTLMCNAFLLYRCDRYDIRGKERLKTNGKYYVVDQGLRNRVVGVRPSDRGHITENVVYLELRRRGFEVCIGQIPGAEIDFIASQGNERYYIQVSETVTDQHVMERELAPFAKLNDYHPRVLITKDWTTGLLENGVRQVNLYEFLLGQSL